jgi:hypothetical protein
VLRFGRSQIMNQNIRCLFAPQSFDRWLMKVRGQHPCSASTRGAAMVACELFCERRESTAQMRGQGAGIIYPVKGSGMAVVLRLRTRLVFRFDYPLMRKGT